MRELVIQKLKRLYLNQKVREYINNDCVDSNGNKYNFNSTKHLGDVELLELLIDVLSRNPF